MSAKNLTARKNSPIASRVSIYTEATIGSCLLLLLASCTTANFVPNNESFAPTCQELRAIYRESSKDFAGIRNNLEVSKSSSIYTTYATSQKLRGASSCVVRKRLVDYEYYCRWESGNNNALMGAHYRSIRDQLKSCLKEASVWEDDRGGYTSVTIETDNGSVSFRVSARYQNPPFYVTLTAKRD